jgi:hypothetical protein
MITFIEVKGRLYEKLFEKKGDRIEEEVIIHLEVNKYLKLDFMVEKPGDLISEVIFKILMILDILHLLLFRSVLIKVQL